MLDPWMLLRLPLLMIRLGVSRWGWKIVLAGWAASLALIPILIHYAVMANAPRTFVLPGASYKPITEGSVYDDDLLIDSGRLPA